MTTRAVAEIDDWDTVPFSGGYAGLGDLADEEFSGVVQSGAAKCCLLNGTVVGVLDGSIEDFEDGQGTAYEASSPALPLLALMQERGDEVRAKYYTEDTSLSEVDRTLSNGGFSGYIELSENVLSGDYYVVYHAGRSMSVAWVGNVGELLTDDEAFRRADDEVGIYEVRQVDVEPVEIPETSGDSSADATAADAGVAAASTGEADDESDASTVAEREPSDTGSIPSLDPARTTGDEESAEGTGVAVGSDQTQSGARVAGAGTETGSRTSPSPDSTESVPEQAREASGAGSDRSTSRSDPATQDGGAETSPESPSGAETSPESPSGAETSPESPSGAETNPESPSGAAEQGGTASSRPTTHERGQPGSSERVAELETRLDEREAELDRLESELASAESDREELRQELERVREERDGLQSERDELAAKLDERETELDRVQTELNELEGEFGGVTDADERLTPAEALDGTNLFVRYESKGKATLESAHSGSASREEVYENLNLELHTQFDAASATVERQSYDEFLRGTLQYRFVAWVVQELLWEIHDTGTVSALKSLYDAIPEIDRAELDGVVTVEFTEDGQQRRSEESFDIVLRDRMGNPLVVTNLNDSREAASQEMLNTLVTAASRVSEAGPSMAAAIFVTSSFFEPEALETVADATSGSLLSRDKRESFVKLSRKRGYHLCLVEARDEQFHLAVPEL
jgi:hypothetical protein